MVFAQKCNTKAGYIDISKAKFLDQSTLKKYTDEDYLSYNDIIINSTGTGTLGRIGIYMESDDAYGIKIVPDSHITIVRTMSSEMNSRYVYYFLKYHQSYFENSGVGSTNQKELKPEVISTFLVAVPPIEEQNNIVSKIDIANNYSFDLDNKKEQLKELISAIKSKILDLAIRGKLVPQDPNDEPASVLLERIRAEKEELIKQGKIKRDKKESVIFKGDDNSYYQDLPDNWVNIKLSTISEVITKGTTPRGGKVAYADNGIGFLRAENIAGYDKLDLNNLNYVDEKSHNDFLKRSILKANDILITIAGTLGRTAVVPSEALPLNTNQAVAIVRLVNCKLVNVKFIIFAINSPTIKKDLLMQSVDMAIPNLSLENISNCTIPLPPLSEQERIVNAVETLFAQIDKIAEQIS